MNAEQFTKAMKQMAQYAVDYKENLPKLRPIPSIKPGFIKKKIDTIPPSSPVKWDKVFSDIKRVIEPGMTIWGHPTFYAYYPTIPSYASVLGDFLCSIYNAVGFSWSTCPALTELEQIVLDMVAQMLDLPKHFLHTSGVGGGFFTSSGSDSIYTALMCAKHKKMSVLTRKHPNVPVAMLQAQLVAYTSCQAHSAAIKAGLVAGVKVREMETDGDYRMRGNTVEEAVELDLRIQLHPFLVLASSGTTGTCSFDYMSEITRVCEKYDLWLHADASYGGNSRICQEFRYLTPCVDKLDSFNVDLNKGLMVAFDSSCLYLRNKTNLQEAFTVDPIYLTHTKENPALDLRHFGLPFTRRFRALHVWFCLRLHGIKKMQEYQRHMHKFALLLKEWIDEDPRLEVVGKPLLGLVCFRMKGNDANYKSQMLLSAINKSGMAHMIPSLVGAIYFIRWCISSERITEKELARTWKLVQRLAKDIAQEVTKDRRHSVRSERRLKSYVETPLEQLENINFKTEASQISLFDSSMPWIASLPPSSDDDSEVVDRYRKKSVIQKSMLDPDYLDKDLLDKIVTL